MTDPELRDLLRDPLEKEWDPERWTKLAIKLRELAGPALGGLPLFPGDVEDVVQEVILRFIDNSASRRIAGQAQSPGPYIMVVLRNAARDLLRKRERHKSLDDVREPAVAPDEIERLHRQRVSHRLVAILRDLPPAEQELIRLRFFRGLTLKEIATRHDIAVATAYYRLKQILVAIRRKLDEH